MEPDVVDGDQVKPGDVSRSPATDAVQDDGNQDAQ